MVTLYQIKFTRTTNNGSWTRTQNLGGLDGQGHPWWTVDRRVERYPRLDQVVGAGGTPARQKAEEAPDGVFHLQDGVYEGE